MFTRRDFLVRAGALAALGAAGAAGLSACATDTSTGTAGEDGATPVRGGTLTLGTTGEPDSWDLHVSVSTLSAVALRPVYDSLVHRLPDGSFEPWLAREWTVSPDGLRYTFELRDDVTFSDGTPFDAQAVAANFAHVVAPTTGSRNAKTLLGPFTGTEVTGPHTVVVVLSKAYSPLLGGLSSPYLGFHSPAALAAPVAIAAGGKGVISTGPFVFDAHTPGQEAVFRRREGYTWAPPSAAASQGAWLDGYTYRVLADDSARIGALTSGQLDVADSVPAGRVKELQGGSGLTLVARDTIGAPFTYSLNVTRAPFDDRNVRLAFQSSVDVETLVQGLFQGQYGRGWSAVTSSTPGYDAAVEGTWGYDADKAASLLDAAGFTGRDADGYRTRDGARLSVELAYAAEYTTSEQATVHTALQDSVRRTGFELVLRPLDTPSIVAVLSSGSYHLGAAGPTGQDASLLRTLFHSTLLPATGGANVSRVADAEIDGWLDSALSTTDTTEQAKLYGQVQQKVIGEALILPTYVGRRTYGTAQRVHGFDLDSQNLPTMDRAWVGG
jgi:peptide/nickel transport system substrate-binding protein